MSKHEYGASSQVRQRCRRRAMYVYNLLNPPISSSCALMRVGAVEVWGMRDIFVGVGPSPRPIMHVCEGVQIGIIVVVPVPVNDG